MQPTIYAVGFGPGDVLHMTTQAVSVLQTVDVIVGYTTYIPLWQEQCPDKQFRFTPMRQEIDRCKWFTPEEARANIRPNSLAEWFLDAYLDEKK